MLQLNLGKKELSVRTEAQIWGCKFTNGYFPHRDSNENLSTVVKEKLNFYQHRRMFRGAVVKTED